MDSGQRLLRAALRLDLATFIHRTFLEVSPGADVKMTWYMQAIAYHLQLCAERKITRLIINIPPRYGKSISCSVAFVAWPDGTELWCEGVVEGVIATERRGSTGWGYDPVFQPIEGGGRTFAEMGADAKNAMSHRARAFRALAAALRER